MLDTFAKSLKIADRKKFVAHHRIARREEKPALIMHIDVAKNYQVKGFLEIPLPCC